MPTKLFCHKVMKVFTQAIQYMQTATSTAQIWLSLYLSHARAHTHTHTMVEQYGETDLLKKEEKQDGYTDNGSIMYLEMERELRCYNFQHSSQGCL